MDTAVAIGIEVAKALLVVLSAFTLAVAVAVAWLVRGVAEGPTVGD